MLSLATGLLLLLCAALVALLVSEHRGRRDLAWFSKPVASAVFIALAVTWGGLESLYGRVVLAALAWSWVGDVLLISRSRRVFRFGIAAFLLGHAAYVGAFIVLGVSLTGFAVAAVVLAVAGWIVGPRILAHVPENLFGAVVVYMVVISAMVASAVGVVVVRGVPLLLAAAVLFYVSDLLVARQRFVVPGFVNRLVGLPLYYGAQVAFAYSVGLV